MLPSEVKAAEKLGVRLPASYVSLVTTHGPFSFQHVFRDGSGFGNEFNVLLTPAQLARQTMSYRRHLKQLAREGEPIAEDIFENAIVFSVTHPDVTVFNLLRTRAGDWRRSPSPTTTAPNGRAASWASKAPCDA